MKIALFGGLYSNYLALESAITDAQQRNVDAAYCLGDLGAFGPYPDRVFPILHQNSIECVQGNYDDSIGNDLTIVSAAIQIPKTITSHKSATTTRSRTQMTTTNSGCEICRQKSD